MWQVTTKAERRTLKCKAQDFVKCKLWPGEIFLILHMYGLNKYQHLLSTGYLEKLQRTETAWRVGSSIYEAKRAPEESQQQCQVFTGQPPLLLPVLKKTLQSSPTSALWFTWQSILKAQKPDCSGTIPNWCSAPVIQRSSGCRHRPELVQSKAWKTGTAHSQVLSICCLSLQSVPWALPATSGQVQPLPMAEAPLAPPLCDTASALEGQGHALAKENVTVFLPFFSLGSYTLHSGQCQELPSGLFLRISIMQWQLLQPHLQAGPCKLSPLLFLLSINVQPPSPPLHSFQQRSERAPREFFL